MREEGVRRRVLAGTAILAVALAGWCAGIAAAGQPARPIDLFELAAPTFTAFTSGARSLASGHSVLRIEARDYDSLPGKPLEIHLEVIPPLWRQTWFLSIAAVLFLLVWPVIYFVRVRQLSNQKAELERIVTSRTAELAKANSQLAELSRMDSLTGVANRRCLDDAIDKEWRRAKRQKVSLSLLMLDVDHFKAYNDRLGHPAGDRCLKSVAVALAALHTRAGEMVARYGGEEFAVLLPTVPHAAAVAAAERVRERVSDLQIPHPESDVGPVVTISIGVATVIPIDGLTAADLVDAADRALYQAKHEGRNRVRGVEDITTR